MQDTYAYQNPPIQEALVGFNLELEDDLTIDAIDAFHELIKEDFPQKTFKKSVAFSFSSEPGSSSSIEENELEGVLFKSGDGTRVLQLNKDSLAFSYVNTYSSWESFLDEFYIYRDKLQANFKIKLVSKIWTRFINMLLIPRADGALDDYLSTNIKLGDMEEKPSEYLVRAVLPFEDYTCVLTEVSNPNISTDTSIGVILDIEVSFAINILTEKLERTSKEWERLRSIKNEVFEKSLTPKMKELFR